VTDADGVFHSERSADVVLDSAGMFGAESKNPGKCSNKAFSQELPDAAAVMHSSSGCFDASSFR
jgi:hypothetical protein